MITAGQIKAARKLLGWRPMTLSRRAKLNIDIVHRLEWSGVATVATFNAIQNAFEAAGVEFTNGGQPDARMRQIAEPEGLT